MKWGRVVKVCSYMGKRRCDGWWIGAMVLAGAVGEDSGGHWRVSCPLAGSSSRSQMQRQPVQKGSSRREYSGEAGLDWTHSQQWLLVFFLLGLASSPAVQKQGGQRC